jgi:hypothetical protein
MSTHHSSSYFNPHPMSRLAYLAEAVRIWCDWNHAQPAFHESRSTLEDTKEKILADAIKKFGPDNPAIPDLVRAEYEAVLSYSRSKTLAIRLERLLLDKPGRNNRRADTPRHLPLRPHAKIIAMMVAGLAHRYPGKSKNALRNLCADMANHGIPASKADGRLTNWSIRNAERAYYATGKDMLAEIKRASKRIETWGGPNFWDRGVIEQMLWAKSESGGDPDLKERLYDVDFRWTYELLRAFERIYGVAWAENRFKGLRGVDLARAIDAACGLSQLAARCLDHQTLAAAQVEIRTGFANAAA